MGSATLPGSLTVAQKTSFWLGFLREQESKPKGYWEGPRRSALVFHRAAIRKDRIKPLRDTMPSERKRSTPKGRASIGKARPSGYAAMVRDKVGVPIAQAVERQGPNPEYRTYLFGAVAPNNVSVRAMPVIATATLPGSIAPNVGELRAQLALNDARAARKARVRQALGH